MRRATLLAVTAAAGLTLLPATAAAQNSRFAGISGGATSSDMRGGVTNTNSRWGGTAGLFVGYRSWRMVGVLEANWVQKGGKDAVGDGSTRIDYIEVPFLIGGASEAGGFLIRFYTGIGVGFPIGCNSTSTDPQQNCDLKKSPQWTWPFGLILGRSLGDGRTFMAVDARYSIALGDTFEGAFMQNYTWSFKLMVGRSFF